MKGRLCAGLMIVLITAISNAQQSVKQEQDFKCGSIITSHNNEVVEYKFKSLEDLNEEIEEIIKEFDFDNSKKNKDVCEIMVELKLEMLIGATTVLLSETIKTNCGPETTAMAVKKLKAMILATQTDNQIVKS